MAKLQFNLAKDGGLELVSLDITRNDAQDFSDTDKAAIERYVGREIIHSEPETAQELFERLEHPGYTFAQVEPTEEDIYDFIMRVY